MIRLRALALLLLVVAAPAAAQQAAADGDAPVFDAAMVDDCLAAQTGEGDPSSCIGLAADACATGPYGDSTVGMSYCYGQERDHWDALLNATYARVMAQSKATDAEMQDLGSAAPAQVPRLREMQRSWIAFRDAACAFEVSQWGGGTGSGPAGAQCALTLTARQYLHLAGYLREGG